MKCLMIFVLIAFANATPLTGWGGMSDTQVTNVNTPFYEKLGWSTHQNLDSPVFHNQEKELPHQVAKQIIQQGLHAKLTLTHETIKNLQHQLQEYQENWSGVNLQGVQDDFLSWTPQYYLGTGEVHPHGVISHMAHQVVKHTEPEIIADAIQYLVEDMQYQMNEWPGLTTGFENEITHQLQNTVEVALKAQIIADSIHDEEVAQGVTVPRVTSLHTNTFKTRIQKLLDQYNEQEIEKEIGHHHHWAQQLHYQEQFINQQKHQIEVQQALVHQQRVSPQHIQQLELAHQKLEMHERDLIKQEVAHHLAVLHLQHALVRQAQLIQEDTVTEHIHERAEQGNQPWSWPKY